MTEFLTKQQQERLDIIRKSHAEPSHNDPIVSQVRHQHRGELLDIVDTLLAHAENYRYSSKFWHGASKFWHGAMHEANKRANELKEANDAAVAEAKRLRNELEGEKTTSASWKTNSDHWYANAIKFENDRRELREMNRNLKRDLDGLRNANTTMQHRLGQMEAANDSLVVVNRNLKRDFDDMTTAMHEAIKRAFELKEANDRFVATNKELNLLLMRERSGAGNTTAGDVALQQNVTRLERENANLRAQGRPPVPTGGRIGTFDLPNWIVERMPGVSMRLSVLVERYNRVADVLENG